MEIQRGMTESSADVSEDRRIEFGIGINVGNIIIIDEGDIYGDIINVAARIEATAEPGGISISEDARRQPQGKAEANFVDAGEQSLKNIARPPRVYRPHLAPSRPPRPKCRDRRLRCLTSLPSLSSPLTI